MIVTDLISDRLRLTYYFFKKPSYLFDLIR